MRKLWTLCLVLTLFLTGCSQTTANEQTWQEQYDLGVRYLSEGNYEEAVIAFTAAIEIDPKRPEAYLKTAEVYQELGDPASALAILEQGYTATGDSVIFDRIKAIQSAPAALSENITVLLKQTTTLYNPGLGYIDQSYTSFEYDEQGYLVRSEDWVCFGSPSDYYGNEWTCTRTNIWEYDKATHKWIHKVESRYDDEKTELKSYWPGTHSYAGSYHYAFSVNADPYPENNAKTVLNAEYQEVNEFGESGRDWYSANYTYDVDGNAVLIESFSIDGVLLGICELEYGVIEAQTEPESTQNSTSEKSTFAVGLKYDQLPELFFVPYDGLEGLLDRPVRQNTIERSAHKTELNSSSVYMNTEKELQVIRYIADVHGLDYCDFDDLGKGQATATAPYGNSQLLRLYILGDTGSIGWLNIDMGDSHETVLSKLGITGDGIQGGIIVDVVIKEDGESLLVVDHEDNKNLSTRVSTLDDEPMIRVTFIDEEDLVEYVILFEFSNDSLSYVAYENVILQSEFVR